MREVDFYSLFLLGLLGTGHCLGMCGPLVLAFPTRVGGFGAHVLYHLGRVTTYVAVGALMGTTGAALNEALPCGMERLIWMTRIQVGFSFLAAAFLLLFALVRLDFVSEPSWMSAAAPMRIPGCTRLLQSAAVGRSRLKLFAVGLALGLLPCGLSFAAFARALPSGGALQGGLLVLAFGLGTLPGLVLIGTGASRLAGRYRKQLEVLAGLLMIAMALSLIADGLQALAGKQ